MTKRLSDEWREQAAKAEARQLRNELRDPYGHGRAVTWYSQGPDGEFDLHASADDARAAAEAMLEHYSDNAASDGEWNTDIGNLQWGRLVPHEVANIHEIPAPEGFPDGEYWDVTLVMGDLEPRE